MRMDLVWNAPDGHGGFAPRTIHGRIRARITRRALSVAKKWAQRLRDHGEEDSSWDWAVLTSECPAGARGKKRRYEHYSLWVTGELQALMILEVSGGRRLTRERSLPQIHIEYLCVAPHNRPGIQQPRKVIGCGAAMVRFAITLSAGRGWQGRVGLHSLPGALTFYKKQGFLDLGPDPLEEGFHSMEFGGML